jgi:hypothetical protein
MKNDLKYDIVYDLVSEGQLPVSEVSFYTSPAIKKIVADTPLVTKKEFTESIQKGDIVVAFSAKKQFMKTKLAKIMAKIIATAQGSPYSSAKYAIDDNFVAGYGIQVIDHPEDNKITKMNKRQFVTARGEMILIKIPELTDAQKDKAANFIIKRIGMPYQGLDLLKTSWNRLMGRKFFSFLKDKPVEPETVKLLQEPLFCSNMITLALLSAGFKKRFNNKHPWDTWPRDFILADFTKTICRIEPK